MPNKSPQFLNNREEISRFSALEIGQNTKITSSQSDTSVVSFDDIDNFLDTNRNPMVSTGNKKNHSNTSCTKFPRAISEISNSRKRSNCDRSVIRQPKRTDLSPIKSLSVLGILSCDTCDYTTRKCCNFQIHLLSSTHAENFEKRNLPLYCSLCTHFSAQKHKFRSHCCSKKNQNKVNVFGKKINGKP